MVDDETYFSDLIRQGYSVNDAVEHTRTYFPNFRLDKTENSEPNGQPSVESIAAAIAQILDNNSSDNLELTEL